MKLYKKLFDVDEINGDKIFDTLEAEYAAEQFRKNYNLYKEQYERNTDIVADFIVYENGVKKKLECISYKDYHKNCKNYDDSIVICFYEQLYFPTNNIWENIW